MEKKTRIIKLEHKNGTVLMDGKKYHLYFSNNEEIKEGDWYLHDQKPTGLRIQTCLGDNLPMDAKKILATTDKSLNLAEVCNYTDEIIDLGLPQLPKSFIEKYCELGGINEVLVEYKLNQSVEGYYDNGDPIKGEDFYKLIPKVDSYNTITIHPIKDSWSKEELLKLSNGQSMIVDWIEENL